ncbi:MAG: drug resistance transporter, EmrB/QacA subfamily [Amycolatopsis sp.]|uniref:MFS transporter n=1 Tax=Amycolatopsis sp. TaxID=37632 RepID=UPI00260E3BC5|nr:MFS transporter [Amycolatopsis sp.]MCU1684729.1 drug resistance transporter, EmrB/QacA subfamily [Amycolatopsis sp.]
MSVLDVRRRIFTEPAPLASIAASPRAPWYAVATVCVGAFMGQLDASIVTLALPTMSRDFGVSVGAVEWVSLSYLLTVVAAVTVFGWLADAIGRKLLYTYGFGVFVLGSALCGFAPNLGLLIAARVLQALGAAMLQANSVALIRQVMPPDRLGRGIGVQGAAQAVGLALGPTVGGLLMTLGGWPLIFLVNVPFGLVGLVAGRYLLPRSAPSCRNPFDTVGAALFVPASALLLVVVSLGRELRWDSVLPYAVLGGAVALAVTFVRHERRTRYPFVAMSLFGNRTFVAGVTTALLSYLVMFGLLFAAPFVLQYAHGLSPAHAGLLLGAFPVCLAITAPLAGRLADAVGARVVTACGLLLTTVALAWLAFAAGTTGLVVGLAVAGIGLGAFTPANNAAVMGAVPRERAGTAGGLLNMIRGMGTALGVAVTGVVYEGFAGSGAGGGFRAAALFLAAAALAGAALCLSVRTQRGS